MDITGKRVTVTVEGFGSKEGVVDRVTSSELHALRPYHVTFDDGMSGWFDSEQVGLVKWVAFNDPTRTAHIGIDGGLVIEC